MGNTKKEPVLFREKAEVINVSGESLIASLIKFHIPLGKASDAGHVNEKILRKYLTIDFRLTIISS
jgi:hypothetical protein